MPKIMLNGIEYASGIDHQKLLKIGDAPLDTTADNLSDAVNELKSSLSNLGSGGYVTTGLSFASGVTVAAGGYCKVGKMVFLNIRLTLSGTIVGATNIITGLPLPAGHESNLANISVMNNKLLDIVLATQGQVLSTSSISAGTLVLSCSYVCS